MPPGVHGELEGMAGVEPDTCCFTNLLTVSQFLRDTPRWIYSRASVALHSHDCRSFPAATECSLSDDLAVVYDVPEITNFTIHGIVVNRY